jgi:hypothetical protein
MRAKKVLKQVHFRSGAGLLLKGSASGYTTRSFSQTGFYASGDVRAMMELNTPVGPAVLLGVNDEHLKLFRINIK